LLGDFRSDSEVLFPYKSLVVLLHSNLEPLRKRVIVILRRWLCAQVDAGWKLSAPHGTGEYNPVHAAHDCITGQGASGAGLWLQWMQLDISRSDPGRSVPIILVSPNRLREARLLSQSVRKATSQKACLARVRMRGVALPDEILRCAYRFALCNVMRTQNDPPGV